MGAKKQSSAARFNSLAPRVAATGQCWRGQEMLAGGARREKTFVVNAMFRPLIPIIALLLVSACGHSISVGGSGSPPLPPPGPEFAYVTNSGDDLISGFSIDHKTGALGTPKTIAAGTASGLLGLAATGSGKFLYAANPADNKVYGFKINQTTGVLSPTAQGSVDTGAGTAPSTLAVSPGSQYLYVVDSAKDQLFSYSITASSGALKAIGSGPIGTGQEPVSIAISPRGGALFVANLGDGNIEGYAIAKDGTLSETGLIDSLGTAPGEPQWLVADPSGAALYDADALGGSGGSISAFNIAGVTLSFLGLFATGNLANLPLSATVSPTLPLVYAANGANNNLSQYQITGSGLSSATLVPGVPSANSIIADQSGKFVYVTDQSDAMVFQFAINQTNGNLTPIGSGSVDTESPANGTSAPFQVITVAEPAPG